MLKKKIAIFSGLTNKTKANEILFVDQLCKFIYRFIFDFVYDWLRALEKSDIWVYKNEMPKNVSDKEEKIKSSSVNFIKTLENIQD